jgi:branched-chain amino acid transport system permease protein
MTRDRLLATAKARPELAVPVVVLAATFFFPDRASLGVYALGLVGASLLLLPAIGIILVHRSNRIVNFSQVVIATATATLFTVLTTSLPTNRSGLRGGYFPLARLVSKVCEPCVDKIGSDPEFIALGRSTYVVNYVVALLVAMAFALLLTMACYLIVQRFAGAPRLIVTVATIFVAEVTAALSLRGLDWIIPKDQRGAKGIGFRAVPPPWSVKVGFHGIAFGLGDILTVAVTVAAVGLVALYVARSTSGTAIRAAAENPARVATLGIDANRVVAKVWVVAGLLAGTAGILLAMLEGLPSAGRSPLSLTLLVRILAVAVIARLSSLPVACGAAVALGVAEQTSRASFGSTVLFDGSLLGIIAVTMLLQHRRSSRAEVEQAGAWQAEREIRPIPVELRSLPVVRTWVRTGAVVGVALMLGVPWLLSAGQTNLFTLTLLYAMIGLSLLVLTGWAGQISLGQVALAAFGAYAAAWSGLPFLLALVAGAVSGALAATLIGLPALRLRGLNLAIISLAFAVSTSSFLLDKRYLGKDLPARIDRPSLLGLSLDDGRVYYYVILAFLGLAVAAVLGMRRSRTARAYIALRDNEQAAQSFGITASRARLSAFAVSGAIAGFAGALIAFADGAVDPSRFAPDFGVRLFLASVIGGFGTIAGPLLGAVYLGVLPLLGTAGATITQFGGLGGLVLLIGVGGGLSQVVFRVRDNLLRRVAHRYGIVVPSLVADVRTEGIVQKAPIEPKRRSTGGTAFVPHRYRVAEQWAFGASVALQVTPDDEAAIVEAAR